MRRWFGGADRIRTCDLLIANETLYQLSYDPDQFDRENSKALPKLQAAFWAPPSRNWRNNKSRAGSSNETPSIKSQSWSGRGRFVSVCGLKSLRGWRRLPHRTLRMRAISSS